MCEQLDTISQQEMLFHSLPGHVRTNWLKYYTLAVKFTTILLLVHSFQKSKWTLGLTGLLKNLLEENYGGSEMRNRDKAQDIT